MEFLCFPNRFSSGLSTIPTPPMSQTETVKVSFSGETYFTQSTATSPMLRGYFEQEPPLWSPPPSSQFQLMRNPTAQPLVGLEQPVTGNYTPEPYLPAEITNTLWPLAYPAQQHSYITPSAEQQTNENHINLSDFPSEEDAIDRLLPSDKKHQKE